MYVAYQDKLLNFTEKHADEIAREWSKSLKSNPRTASYRKVPEATLEAQGAAFYRNAKRLYFEQATWDRTVAIYDSQADCSTSGAGRSARHPSPHKQGRLCYWILDRVIHKLLTYSLTAGCGRGGLRCLRAEPPSRLLQCCH